MIRVAGRAVFVLAFLALLGAHVLTAGPRVTELPPGFGKPAYLSTLKPGTWFWSETKQRVYLVVEGNRYCDPTTGDVWESRPQNVGFPCRVTLSVTRPNSFDIRPWSAPEGN